MDQSHSLVPDVKKINKFELIKFNILKLNKF